MYSNVEILSSGGHFLFTSMMYRKSATLVKAGFSTQPKAKHLPVDFSFKMTYPPLKTINIHKDSQHCGEYIWVLFRLKGVASTNLRSHMDILVCQGGQND